jgi:DNA (cytosine-5)-methyltransferase 1
MKSEFEVLDCFSGAGGLSLGFKNAGFKSVFAFDSDAACAKTYCNNIGDVCHVADASKLNKNSIEEITGHRLRPDVIIGGPPCQGFSVQRRGGDVDSRNQLVLDYIRLVLEFSPKIFVMENVGGILSPRGKTFVESLLAQCAAGGYSIQFKKLCAFNYGVPQLRHRVFFVGQKISLKLQPFVFPTEGSVLGSSTVRQAIGDLINKSSAEVPNHKGDKLSSLNLKRIRFVKEGEGRDSLPPELQLKCHKSNKGHRHLDVYGRMWWDKPAPTITARFDSFSRGRFGHPSLDRTITLREGARLQSFPDDFSFFGSKVEVAKQIGNAVPPNLAYAVAQAVLSTLKSQL